MKPLQQVIELTLDDIPEYQARKEIIEDELEELKNTLTEEKYEHKRELIRYKEVNRIVFDAFIK